MPRNSHRKYYPAVSTLVVVLFAVFALTSWLKRFIPPPDTNALAESKVPYLKLAAASSIPWRELSPTSFAEAKRTDKPILLVVGSVANYAARFAERIAFSDPQVVSKIQAAYIPIRVDSSIDTTLPTALLPLSRGPADLDTGFQIWFLNADGQYVYHRMVDRPRDRMGVDEILAALAEASKRYRDSDHPTADYIQPWVRNAQESNALLDPTISGAPDIAKHIQFLANQNNFIAEDGAWPSDYGEKVVASELRFLLSVNAISAADGALSKIVASPIVDWIDGGFFYQARGQHWKQIEYDKLAEPNADMVSVLAQAYCLTGRPIYRRVALDTFNFLATRLKNDDGVVVPFQVGDEMPLNRSRHASFSPVILSNQVPAEDQDWLRQYMDLSVESNSEMLPNIGDIERYTSIQPELDSQLQKLRKIHESEPRVVSEIPVCSVSCRVVARLLEAARLLNDPQLKSKASELYLNLEYFTVLDQASSSLRALRHAPDIDDALPTTLADYLGYADASMQYYLATGESFAINDGLAALQIAKRLFATGIEGVWLNRDPILRPQTPKDGLVPEMIDTNTDSTASQAIQVTQAYSRVLRWLDPERNESIQRELLKFAQDGVIHYGPLANQIQRKCGGYYLAAGKVQRATFVLVVGPDSVEKSTLAFGRHPTEVFIPLVPNLEWTSKLQNGCYVVISGQAQGPMSIEDAELALSNASQIPEDSS